MKLAFGHHRDLLNAGETRPGTFGIHCAAENIAMHLREQMEGFDYFAPLKNRCTPAAAVRIALNGRFEKGLYYGWAEPSLSRGYGRQFRTKLEASDADVLLCNETKHAAFVNSKKPVAIWTDSIYGGLFDYYKTFSNLCDTTRRHMEEMDRAAVASCSRLIFASDWAARTVIECYGADPAKVKVAPYGANFAGDLSREQTQELVRNKNFDEPCRLLFSGVEWHRKGGDTAVEVARRMNDRGIRTELIVLGNDPARHMESVPDFVTTVGYLSLGKPEELERMKELYRTAHFLFLPCRAECFGHIFPEANSFGLPAITSNTGGIPTAVHEGVNGYCFDPEDADAYVDCMVELFKTRERYYELSMKAYDDYHARLTWEQAAKQVASFLREL